MVLPTPFGPTTPSRVRGPTVTSTPSSTEMPPRSRARSRATSENEADEDEAGEDEEGGMRRSRFAETRNMAGIGRATRVEPTVRGMARDEGLRDELLAMVASRPDPDARPP